MVARPIVDGIETRYQDRLTVLRLNIQEPSGQAFARQYSVFATPTFIFFDADGHEIWRSIGQIDPSLVDESLK